MALGAGQDDSIRLQTGPSHVNSNSMAQKRTGSIRHSDRTVPCEQHQEEDLLKDGYSTKKAIRTLEATFVFCGGFLMGVLQPTADLIVPLLVLTQYAGLSFACSCSNFSLHSCVCSFS